MTTAPEVVARRARRDAHRDTLATTDVRPGTGQDSTVSPAAMTRLAYQVRGLSEGPQQSSGLAGDLAATVNAATLPARGQGQAQAGTGDGARSGTQPNQSRGISKGERGT
jgi:hypothetical protein